MNKGGNSCKSYLKWPQKQVFCCFKIKLKLLMIVLFLFVYIHTCIRIRKYFLYNIAVLYHSFTHSIYLYICFAKTISISFMACLLPGVNSAISVRDEWTFISQWMKLVCLQWTTDRSKVKASNHSCDSLYFKLCTYSEIYDLIKTLHCWFFLSLKRYWKHWTILHIKVQIIDHFPHF